jgi:hypothetical protein
MLQLSGDVASSSELFTVFRVPQRIVHQWQKNVLRTLLGTGSVQEGTHSKSQDVSVTDSYILHTVQRIANPGGRAGTACLLGLRARILPGAWIFDS